MSDTVAVPRRTTVIVIDPTDRQGQDGLNAIHPAETCVALLLPLYGRWSRALDDFAAARGLAPAQAGTAYLEEAGARLLPWLDELDLVTVDGADLVRDIEEYGQRRPLARVILPSSLVRDRRLSVERLHTRIPAALTITRPRPSAPYWDRRRRIRAA